MQIHSGIFGLGFKSNQVGQMTGKIWAVNADGIPTGNNTIEIGYLPLRAIIQARELFRSGDKHNAAMALVNYCDANKLDNSILLAMSQLMK
jgi:hypothetical protein